MVLLNAYCTGYWYFKDPSKVFVAFWFYFNPSKQKQKEEDGEIQVYCKMLKIIRTIS